MRWLCLAIVFALPIPAHAGDTFIGRPGPSLSGASSLVDSSEQVPAEYCPMIFNGRCFDGREVTTTRSTPVPCGSGTAGVDVGCYDGGLHGWVQATNYLLESTNFSTWTLSGGATVAAMTDATGPFWRVSLPAGGTAYKFATSGGTVCGVGATCTTTCEMRAVSGVVRLANDNASGVVQSLDAGWRRVSVSRAVGASGGRPTIHSLAGDGGGVVDVRQCQAEASATPGRRCDSGATPATCAAEENRISSTGWPAERGELCVTFVPGTTAQTYSLIIDGRNPTNGYLGPAIERVTATSRLNLTLDGQKYDAGPAPLHTATRVCIGRRGGVVTTRTNGSVVFSGPAPAFTWNANVVLGRFAGGSSYHLNGTLSRIEWSNQ